MHAFICRGPLSPFTRVWESVGAHANVCEQPFDSTATILLKNSAGVLLKWIGSAVVICPVLDVRLHLNGLLWDQAVAVNRCHYTYIN
eukprot:5107468-Amphidinium_carterae.1